MKKMSTKLVIIFIFVSVANGIEDVQPNPPSLTTATSIVITSETNGRLVRMEPKIDYQSEYEQFRKKLAYMNEIRSQNMIHLENYYRSLMMLVMEQNNTNDSTTAQLADLTFRVYDSETGIQFEDEFDCDLNLLVDCESSLLRKIEIIDGRRVVFTMNRTEEEEVSSQIDMLNVCRSMDKEFTCLINYADKCEKKMNWSTFSILKYIITQNNETIVSCKQKEIDWLGPPKIQEAKYLSEEGQGGEIDEEWIDQNGMGHHLSHQSRGPCIPWTNVSQCWMTNMGIDFGEFGRAKISETDQQQCQSGYHFERCLKKYLYEVDSLCSLDEKEVSLQTILGSIQWELAENRKQRVPNICSELRQRWLQQQRPMIGIQETIYQDKWDRSKRFAFDLRHDFGSLLDPYCDHVVKKFDKPCQNRFERRLRGLWWQEDHQGEQLDPVIEKETICCAISEFKQCVSIYVLIRCGKDSFRYFNNRAKIAQLDQCSGMFDEIRALIGFLQRRSLAIDGPVLSISCRLSSIFMFGGLMVVCSSQLISKPIHCDGVGGKVNQQFLETYCFIYPTYIVAVPDGHHKPYPNDPRGNFTGIFPGIIPFRSSSLSNPDPLIEVNVDYYQWMWIIYFLEALCFYFPHWLWKTMEGRRIRALVSQADMLVDRDPRCDSAEYRQLIRIANYVANSFGSNGKYMARYYFCELIGFLNLFAQMFILNLIFGGHYFTYGLDALKTLTMAKRDDWRRLNPINKIFPRMTKCEYRRYGPSGASEIIDSLCMLPLNVFNDKFFLFFWFWILLMAFLFLMTFFYRLAEILLPFMRTRFLCDLMKFGDPQTLNETRNLMFRLKLSDWFFLNLIANNVDRIFLSRLLKEIINCEKIKNPNNCGDHDQIPMDSLSVQTCSTNACLMEDIHNNNADGSQTIPIVQPGHHHHPSPYPRRSKPFRINPWNNAHTITTNFNSSGKNFETTIF